MADASLHRVGPLSLGHVTEGKPAAGSAVRTLAHWLIILLALPGPAGAQVRDTTRADTLGADRPAQDTLAPPPDSVPPPIMVPWPARPATPGFASAVRVWDHEALQGEGAITLLDLLEQMPGITTLRSGAFLQPEAASTYGSGADRLVVEWDGFVLDPLDAAALDLSGVELGHLEEVRVERRADGLRIRLRSLMPREAEPYSRIDAGVGEPSANLFRGLLLTPRFLFGPLGIAVERVETEGTVRPEPADVFATWVRWGWLAEDRGLELTLRSDRMQREPESPRPAELRRQDVVLRGRSRLGGAFTGELLAGRSGLTIDDRDPSRPDSLRQAIDRSGYQAGARLAFAGGRTGAEAGLRWRDGQALPRWELSLAGHARPLGPLEVAADVEHSRWRNDVATTSYRLFAAGTPLAGIQVFGEYAGGRRGAPAFPADTVPRLPHVAERTMIRGGGEVTFRGIVAGAAVLRAETDSVAPFGLAGEPTGVAGPGGEVTGWEGSLRLPILPGWLSVSGAYSAWLSGRRWAYLPSSEGRVSLDFRGLPLASDNLEIIARVVALRRGEMAALPDSIGAAPPVVAGRTVANAYLQIRILDVRIFLRYEDMLGTDAEELPGLRVGGPRVLYGVKWVFRN